MKNTAESLLIQTSHDKLELKKGGGCIGCFGIPFFAAGIFMLLATMQIIPFSNAKEMPWWSWIILFFMGLIFTGVGAGLVFGRNWLTIDKTRRRIYKARGLLKPMQGEQYDLINYIAVLLRHDPGDSDTAERFPISLQAADGRTELDLTSFSSYGPALEQAKLLASFLRFNLEDKTTDNPRVLKPSELSAHTGSFKAKELPAVAQPSELKSDLQHFEDELQIRIPGPRVSPLIFIGLLIPLGVVVFFAPGMLTFFTASNTPLMVQFFFIGFVGLFFVLLPVLEVLDAFIRSRSFLTAVTVNPEGISITHKAAIRKYNVRLAIAEIIDVDYGTGETAFVSATGEHGRHSRGRMPVGGLSAPYTALPRWMHWLQKFSRSKGIIIKSTQGLYCFGQGLPDEEVMYLYSLVCQYLSK